MIRMGRSEAVDRASGRSADPKEQDEATLARGGRRADRAGRQRTGPTASLTACLAGLACLGLPAGHAQDVDFARPERHFKVERPAALAGPDALIVYDRIVGAMVDGYELSRDAVALEYREWRRFNRTPYRSATHGERYVNNYANQVAAPIYGALDDDQAMPVGSVLAKDSFAVTTAGDVFSGPLFLMEKMTQGFAPEARDWKYTMIMPDGSYFGVTGGEGSERVTFCISCHQAAGDEQDHLFYVPEGNRARAFRLDQLTE
ncbi:MAG: cytochrome P460 family protein [Geminicoccaceae bacterium]|nr:cytochrome P460 family protein [Geminicoccaceae bacterium]